MLLQIPQYLKNIEVKLKMMGNVLFNCENDEDSKLTVYYFFKMRASDYMIYLGYLEEMFTVVINSLV